MTRREFSIIAVCAAAAGGIYRAKKEWPKKEQTRPFTPNRTRMYIDGKLIYEGKLNLVNS